MSIWNFSHKPDSDWGEDDSSGKAVQPDHYPNVARPGGGYPEGKGKESDTPCKTCNQNNLVDGRCPLCDWPNSVSEPIKNFPLDPFKDDKAGIRAGSWKWKFGAAPRKYTIESIIENADQSGFIWTNEEGKKVVPEKSTKGYYLKCKECKTLKGPYTTQTVRARPHLLECQVCEMNKFLDQMGYYWGGKEIPKLKSHLKKYPLMCKVCKQKIKDLSSADAMRLWPDGRPRSFLPNGKSCKNCAMQKRIEAADKLGYLWDPETPPITNTGLYNLICNKCGAVTKNVQPEDLTTKEKYREIKPCAICNPQFAKQLPKLTQDQIQILFNLIKDKTEDDKYSPTEISEEFEKQVGRSIHPRTVQDRVQKWQNEGRISENLRSIDPSHIIYLFQLGSEIKIGIASNMPARIVRYLTERVETKSRGGFGNTKMRIQQPETPVPSMESGQWQSFEVNEPSEEDLNKRGLSVINRLPSLEKDPPDASQLRRDPQRWNQFNLKSEAEAWIEENRQFLSDFEKASENNQFWFAELSNPYIASWIERYIAILWNNMGLDTSPILTNYTEAISADTSRVKNANYLSFDFYRILIENLIENGGHLQQLDEVFDQEDFAEMIKSGNFSSPEEIRELFEGVSFGSISDSKTLGETLGIDFDAVDPNTGEPTTYNFINQILQEKQIEKQNQALDAMNIPHSEQDVIPMQPNETIEPQPVSIDQQWDFTQPNEATPLNETALSPELESQLPPEIIQLISQGLAYPATDAVGNTTIIDTNTDQIIWPNTFTAKTSDHQGSTNWETWNTKVMIDNEYNLYIQSRDMVKNFTPLNEFAIWATQAVIAPHNQQALENAQEWNDIPYDERPTGREHMSEGGQALTEGFDEIFGMDPRADETASIIDESKVDWPQIYNSIAEDIKESERFDHEEGKHDLLTQMYMTDFTAEELGNLQEETYPWCPICKVERPDDPGDLTIPSDWTQ